MEQTLAGLGNRVFLMNNVHKEAPTLFETRWCLSYLRGPLARPQIRQLMSTRKQAGPAPSAPAPQPAAPAAPAAADAPPAGAKSAAPVLPPDIPVFYVPARTLPDPLAYEPRILGAATVHFIEKKPPIDQVRQVLLAAPISDGAIAVDWSAAELLQDIAAAELEKEPLEGAAWSDLPAPAAKPKNYASWSKNLATFLYQSESLELLKSPSIGEVSRPGESERDFRLRLSQSAREKRDELKEKLRARYAPKLQTLQDRLARAMQKVEVEKQQASAQTMDSMISIGSSLLGAFLGGGRRGSSVSKVGSAARKMSRVSKERGDIGLAEDSVEVIQQRLQDLETEFEEEVNSLAIQSDPATEQFEKLSVKPKKANIEVQLVALGWVARA
jgi:hypothetical protein